MRVGINAFGLGAGGGGIETYVRNVIRALANVDPTGAYTLFLQPPLPRDPIPGMERMRRVVVRTRYGPLRVPFASAAALALAHVDLIHVQNAAPLLCPTHVVVTLHDIAYERYPQFLPEDHVATLRRRVPATLRRAAAIITDSEASKREIVSFYSVPPDKVTVALLAADPIFRPLRDEARLEAQLAEVRDRYAGGDHYILFTGDPLQRRKNVKSLVDAYTRLRAAGAVTHRLVLSGDRAALESDIFAAARAAGRADDLCFIGRVPEEELVAIYNAADIFVYPSLYEGFGLPPLEAMACGVPVITSNVSSLPEVVGADALTVDPLDTDALAAAMARILNDVDLQANLSARGLRRAATFSWDATARILVDTYHKCQALPEPLPGS